MALDRRDVRRYISSLDQVNRMFETHSEEGPTPEKPEKPIGGDRSDKELDAELEYLEDWPKNHELLLGRFY